MSDPKVLTLGFRGKVIDHLGIQMYQSPVAAIAELISNAWDADSEKVEIILPEDNETDWEITINDDGIGMTFDDCQHRYLDVGYDRRDGDAKKVSLEKNRPLMGRKGIGKFAGFGIARIVRVETTSKLNGEYTAFELNIDDLREGNTYTNLTPLKIKPNEYSPPDNSRKGNHGTKIILKSLTLGRRPSVEQFRRSMARRFSITSRADEFRVLVNETLIPEDEDLSTVEMVFPRDYRGDETKHEWELDIDNDGWGYEKLPDGNYIKWRFLFYKETISEEELRGISIFSHKKLSQRPFLFNLVGGLTSQTGPEYLSGQIQADYLDEFKEDVIATERQRLNWEKDECRVLEAWGQTRIKQLLGIWKSRRSEQKEKLLDEKLGDFSARIERLGRHEGATVRQALKQLANIEKINGDQFLNLGKAILTAWEHGRLKDLIYDLAETATLDESKLIDILIEAETVEALHMAEAVKAKLETIKGLEARIQKQELENAVRDYISENPWLVSPKWETFAVEKSLNSVMQQATKDSQEGLLPNADWNARVDLVFASGQQLLLLEFMRPGKKVDLDHLNRFGAYADCIQSALNANTAGKYKKLIGYLIADKFDIAKPQCASRIEDLEKKGLYSMDWKTLLSEAKAQWKEFFEHIVERSPNDDRIKSLNEE